MWLSNHSVALDNLYYRSLLLNRGGVSKLSLDDNAKPMLRGGKLHRCYTLKIKDRGYSFFLKEKFRRYGICRDHNSTDTNVYRAQSPGHVSISL